MKLLSTAKSPGKFHFTTETPFDWLRAGGVRGVRSGPSFFLPSTPLRRACFLILSFYLVPTLCPRSLGGESDETQKHQAVQLLSCPMTLRPINSILSSPSLNVV